MGLGPWGCPSVHPATTKATFWGKIGPSLQLVIRLKRTHIQFLLAQMLNRGEKIISKMGFKMKQFQTAI